MKKLAVFSLLLSVMMFSGTGNVYACDIFGRIWCDVNQNGQIDSFDTPLEGVTFVVSEKNGGWAVSMQSDVNGNWGGGFPEIVPQTIKVTITGGLPADPIIIIPATYPPEYDVTQDRLHFYQDFLIDSPSCRQTAGLCWMTAGGVKFNALLNGYVAEKGPRFNFGGNTAPSCSLKPGDGGQWNFVDRDQNVHFQALTVEGVTCGNVDGFNGSTSPKTDFSYIEFFGKGIVRPAFTKGKNGDSITNVKYFARFEDRNEPGSLDPGPNSNFGRLIDRLAIRVVTDPGGALVYLLDNDPSTPALDPILITGGNIQLHPCK